MSDMPVGRPELRVSDADRDRTAEALREAHAQGRITADELEERLNRVYAAKTFAELEPVTSDLPEASGLAAGAAPAPVRYRIGGTARFKFSLAIMGGSSRGGNWVVPPHYVALAIMGVIKIDLSEAHFAAREVTIQAYAIMGGITILVPEDIDVEISGLGLMGSVDHHGEGGGAPGAPRVRVVGLALMGGIEVKRSPVPRPAAGELPGGPNPGDHA